MDHKTTLPFFSLRSQSSLGCCQIKLCIVTSWVVSTKLSLPSSFRIVSSRMASKTRARAPSISCLLCDGLVAYTRADRQRWPFQLMCLENVISAILNAFQYAGLTATWKLSMERQQTSPICWQDAWWARWGQHIENGFRKNKCSLVQWFQTHLWFQSPNINVLTKEERNVVSAIIEEREESKADAVIVEKVKKLMYFPDNLFKKMVSVMLLLWWGDEKYFPDKS